MDSKVRPSSDKPAAVAKRSAGTSSAVAANAPPCGACKFLRRKCVQGCVFAPYFGTEQGTARFAAVHKVFGASNVSKLLALVPVSQRHDAVVTVCYEAQARLSDPVYGCVANIFALQQQVSMLQEEISLVQSQLINSRLSTATILQNSQQQQQLQHIASIEATYSNNSSISTNMLNMSNFQPSVLLDVSDAARLAAPGREAFQLLKSSHNDKDEGAENSPDPVVLSSSDI